MVNPAGKASPGFWSGRKVFLTGHTGFKGSWLTLWLRALGAEVTGYALDPVGDANLFTLARVADDCLDVRGDLCAPLLHESLADSEAEIVLHLAAQPLVRESYRDPKETWRVNVMGTLNLLEACRATESVKTVVAITTDKVYENPEHGRPFREEDALGGHDPYSSSKAACEILCASWRRSFLQDPVEGRAVGLATARAGNVVGGGDFAAERLVPDLVRARKAGVNARLRYPAAVRPWQHVLEPLEGYLRLAEKLHGDARAFSEAYNFGPDKADFRPVGEVADGVCAALGSHWEREDVPQPHEAGLLTLDSARAEEKLGWTPRLPFPETLRWTSEWYAGWLKGADARALTLDQIRAYRSLASA